MNRRSFLAASAAATLAASRPISAEETKKPHRFQLKYAPHFGMFRQSAGKDLVDQLKFAADQGFTAWEDNGMKRRSVETQRRVAKTMEQLDMTMGVFVAAATFQDVTFAGDDESAKTKVLEDIKASVEVA
ncbi:MAG TPA: xylose isomerase, partial [Planctomycetaceae bacterium]|nr:xylose isomerase [Planctomycetaceae bacterium]